MDLVIRKRYFKLYLWRILIELRFFRGKRYECEFNVGDKVQRDENHYDGSLGWWMGKEKIMTISKIIYDYRSSSYKLKFDSIPKEFFFDHKFKLSKQNSSICKDDK